MRLTISIDGMGHQIDTADPELLGRWIVEMFGRMQDWTPATYVTIQAYPSWLPDDRGEYRADWATDSRIISQIRALRSPRDLLTELGKFLDESEALQ